VAVYGKTADSLKCAQLLLERGARRDLPREEDLFVPLHLACWSHEEVKVGFVDLLSADKGSHINARDSRGRIPIFGFLDHLESIQMLLDRGADISSYDNNKMTVLHAASIENRVDALRMFLDRSGYEHALATLADGDGDTPMAKAIECKSVDCAKLLLEAGAIGDLNGKDGLTLVHRAIEMGDADFLHDCFEHPTYKRGIRIHDGMTVMEFAGRLEKFDGRIKELILEYESYVPRSVVKGRQSSTGSRYDD
jgi:ankyrin repeat protein